MMIPHGPTYIYAGGGSWPDSVSQTQEMLAAVLDSRGIKQVDTLKDVDKDTHLVVVPGGKVTEILGNLGTAPERISSYVKNGGRFLGICAGAILATETMISKPPVVDSLENSFVTALQKIGSVYGRACKLNTLGGLSLYPGTCIAPHIVRNLDAEHPDNICAVDVVTASDETFKAFHYSGPAFLTTPADANILLRYRDPLELRKVTSTFESYPIRKVYQLTEEKLVESNPVAALSYSYGAGKIVLTGVHPEINPKTFKGNLPQELSASEPGRLAFVKEVFKELKLG